MAQQTGKETGKVLPKRLKCFRREECAFPNIACHIDVLYHQPCLQEHAAG